MAANIQVITVPRKVAWNPRRRVDVRPTVRLQWLGDQQKDAVLIPIYKLMQPQALPAVVTE